MEITFSKDQNPRYTMFRAAMGDEAPFYKFSLWVKARWRDYANSLGVNPINGSWADGVFDHFWSQKRSTEDAHNRFDQWLKKEVEQGRFTEEP